MPKLIYICGAARTGTTILGHSLGQSETALYVGEAHAFFRPYRAHHLKPDCSCGASPCPVWDSDPGLREMNYVPSLAKSYAVDNIIDSSSHLPWFIDHHTWALRNGYEVVGLLTWKKPIALAYSKWKRELPIAGALEVFDRHYGRILDLGHPLVTLEVSEFENEPWQTLQKICAVLDMPVSEKMMALPDPGHFLFGSEGVRKHVHESEFALIAGGREIIEYPDEFNEAYAKAVTAHGGHVRIDRIVERLRRQDVDSVTTINAEQKQQTSIIKPLWYYKQRIARYYRRNLLERRG